MRILVTGGAGFIGSHVVDAYVAQGHEVLVIDNYVTGLRSNENEAARYVVLDLLDRSGVAATVRAFRPELVNHQAGRLSISQSVADPVANAEVDLRGFLNLMETSREAGTKRVIVASSGGVYGDDVPVPTPETAEAKPISPYGVTKLAMEYYLHYYRIQYGIRWVALRYANVYGPRQNPKSETGVISIFLDELVRGQVPTINGDGEQTRDYVFVADVVSANLLALERGNGPYNIGTGRETSVNQIFDALQAAFDVTIKANRAPGRPGEQRRSALAIERANTELGWQPTLPFNRGLEQTVHWYRAQVIGVAAVR